MVLASNTMALEGLPTGKIMAKEQPMVTGSMKYKGCTLTASACSIVNSESICFNVLGKFMTEIKIFSRGKQKTQNLYRGKIKNSPTLIYKKKIIISIYISVIYKKDEK